MCALKRFGNGIKSIQSEHLCYCPLANYASNKHQTPLAYSDTKIHANSIRQPACEKTDGSFWNPWGNTRKSWTHLPPSFLWSIPEILDSPSVLILSSKTRNKQKNSYISYKRLKHVTNFWAVAHKAFMKRWSFRAPEF